MEVVRQSILDKLGIVTKNQKSSDKKKKSEDESSEKGKIMVDQFVPYESEKLIFSNLGAKVEKRCIGDFVSFTSAEAFSDQECDKIIELYKQIPGDANAGTIGTGTGTGNATGKSTMGVDKSYRTSSVKWIPRTLNNEWIYKKLTQLAIWGNERWCFQIMGLSEQVQIAEYDSDTLGKYDWHIDCGSGFGAMRKISISVQLSAPEDYEGGELQFKTNREERTASKEKGSAVTFPSYFLHRVKPTTKGKRYSLVLWVTGPPFQ